MLLVPKGTPLTDGLASAPVTAIATSSPCTRAEKPPNITSMVARSLGLATRRLARVCERRSAAPERVTPMCARPGLPRSSSRASGPVLMISSVLIGDLLTDRAEADPRAGGQQGGWISVDVPHHGVGVPDQLPAAG